jgi:hypothetical protein
VLYAPGMARGSRSIVGRYSMVLPRFRSRVLRPEYGMARLRCGPPDADLMLMLR